MEDARPPFPWWPQLAWRLNNATGIGDDYSRRLRLRARAASVAWRALTWLTWKTGHGPRCGDYICDRPGDWPRGNVPPEITAFWDRIGRMPEGSAEDPA